MFNAKEKKIIGQVVFDAWTQPSIVQSLIGQPTSFLASRGIKDHHERAFVTHIDTHNTMNLIVPWMPETIRADPDTLSPEERAGQVQGMLRVNWEGEEIDSLFNLLKAIWADRGAATELLERPREALAKYLSESSMAKLGDRRISTHEDSSGIVHFVVPFPPPSIERMRADVNSGSYEPMCSASIGVCDHDDDDDNNDDDNDDEGQR